MEKQLKHLRLAALLGAVAAGARHLIWFEEVRLRQEYGYYALYGVAIAVFLTLMLFQKATARLLKNLDLFVPFGLYLAADEIINLVPTGRFYFNSLTFSLDVDWAKFGAAAVVVWLLQIGAGVVFVGWTTRMILQFSESEKLDPIAALGGVGRWFWRTFAVLAIFKFVPVIAFFPLLGLIAKPGFFGLFVALLGVFTFAYNFLTFAVLFAVLSDSARFWAALGRGLRLSRQNARRAALPVVLQLLILGAVVFVSVDYTVHEIKYSKDTTVTSGGFGRAADGKQVITDKRSESTSRKTNSKYSVNFVWAGSYPDSTDWHKNLMNAVDSTPFSPIDFKLSLLLVLLAIVVKIELAGKIFGFREKDDGVFDGDLFDLKNTGGFLRTENRLKTAAVLLLIGAVGYLFPFELLRGKFKSNEPVVTRTETTGGARENSDEPVENPPLEIPKTYRGAELFARRELFRNEKTAEEKSLPAVGVYREAPSRPDPDEAELNEVDAVYAGEIDAEPGTDVLAAAGDRAFLLDAAGGPKKEIKYRIGKNYDGGEITNDDLAFVGIFDLDGDGRPEIAGWGLDGCVILDLGGKPVWKYRGRGAGDGVKIDAMTVGDVDGDGRNDVLTARDGLVEVFDRDGKLKWSKQLETPLVYELNVADFDGDGRNEVAVGLRIFDGDGKFIRTIETPYLSNGFLLQKNERPAILFFEDNRFGLFDGGGRLLGTYDAPLSYISAPKKALKKADLERFSLTEGVKVFSAEAARVRLGAGEEKYLAVYANASGKENFHILYVYDPRGELVFFETVRTFNGHLAVLPKSDGTDGILLTDDGKILEYSLK